jgi:hypothetical protein
VVERRRKLYEAERQKWLASGGASNMLRMSEADAELMRKEAVMKFASLFV